MARPSGWLPANALRLRPESSGGSDDVSVLKSLAHGACLAVVAAALTLAPISAEASVIKFVTELEPEQPGATGTGSVVLWFDTIAQSLTIDAEFSGLSGLTSVAHIHCCTAVPGVGTVGVAFTPGTLPGFPAGVQEDEYLCDSRAGRRGELHRRVPQQLRPGGIPAGAAGASAALLQGMYDGKAYFNVHTSELPGRRDPWVPAGARADDDGAARHRVGELGPAASSRVDSPSGRADGPALPPTSVLAPPPGSSPAASPHGTERGPTIGACRLPTPDSRLPLVRRGVRGGRPKT